MIVGTAGHVDHGKTALVRALTGVDTDRLPEEKRRGITIELGFAPLQLDGAGTVSVVDVPGHEAFVRTMLAGATGIDLALVVVAADEGVMPQTREHIAILSLLGVRDGVVALTKADVADADWMALVEADVRAALAGTALAGAPIVRCSAVTGAGIDALKHALAEAAARAPARAAGDFFRMPVDRAFTVKGTGTVVTGTVWAGELTPESATTLLPAGVTARVRRIEAHGSEATSAGSGERAAVALVGVERDAIDVRGAWLVRSGDPWVASATLRGDVALLDGTAPLGPRTRVRLHLGTADVGARLVGTGGPVAPGVRRAVRIALDAPVVARAGDRFVLRGTSPAETIGGGVVSDPNPPRHRAKPWPEPGAPPAMRLVWIAREAGGRGAAVAGMSIRLGVRAEELPGLIDSEPGVQRVGELVFATDVAAMARERCIAAIERAHKRQPLEPGLAVQSIRSAIPLSPALIDVTLAALAAVGTITLKGGIVARSGWNPGGSGESKQRADFLLATIRASGNQPPSVDELAKVHGRDTLSVLRLLATGGSLVQVAEDRFFASEMLAELSRTVQGALSGGKALTASELREITGLTRKYLIPILEHFDRTGVTQRNGDRRTIGKHRPAG